MSSKLLNREGAAMPNVYFPRLIQIRAQYSIETDAPDKPENITWWQSNTGGTPTLANLQAIAAIFDAHWPTVWGDVAGTVADYTGCIITDWQSNTGLSYSSVGVITPVAGTHGQLMPPQVAVLLSYEIPIRYKGGHPRTYLPYVGQGALTGVYNDTVNTTNATNAVTDWGTLKSAMAASGVLGGQVAVAYLHKTNPATANPLPISAVICQPRIATQRRRNRRVAHH